MLFDRDPHESEEEPSSPQLLQVQPHLGPEDEHPPNDPGQPRISIPRHRDPGLGALNLSVGHDYLHSHADVFASRPNTPSSGSPEMTDQVAVGPATGVDRLVAEHEAILHSRLPDAKALGAQEAAALATAVIQASCEHRETAKRVDSAQDEVPQSVTVKQQPRSGRVTPLKVQTATSASIPDDSIATSPTLAKHAIPVEQGNTETLPALQPTSPRAHGAPTSPQSERLPSLRHLTELADAATTQHEVRVAQYSHHHSQSFGSATAPSPILPYHIAPNNQMSPSSQYNFSARSPTSTLGDHYSSPTQYPGSAYYMERRTSAIHDPPIGLPSLPSASSSGESHGHPGSSTDGYSTSHTTPIDSAGIPDGIQRNIPILPPPRGMPPQNAALLLGGFKCDYPGCEAPPFATQYLLSSHKNVHSSVRPHYCPVEGCPRSEGGKGFKRKNEMIRHGLVHNSPGYVCPFCPEREHKYPRPDNLQRHVRVHHAEKDRDDPQLREVLNQRTEGPGKTRRKRANTGPC